MFSDLRSKLSVRQNRAATQPTNSLETHGHPQQEANNSQVTRATSVHHPGPIPASMSDGRHAYAPLVTTSRDLEWAKQGGIALSTSIMEPWWPLNDITLLPSSVRDRLTGDEPDDSFVLRDYARFNTFFCENLEKLSLAAREADPEALELSQHVSSFEMLLGHFQQRVQGKFGAPYEGLVERLPFPFSNPEKFNSVIRLFPNIEVLTLTEWEFDVNGLPDPKNNKKKMEALSDIVPVFRQYVLPLLPKLKTLRVAFRTYSRRRAIVHPQAQFIVGCWHVSPKGAFLLEIKDKFITVI